MPPGVDPLLRSRKSLACDLKHPASAAIVRRLAARADALFEGFRPGVAERLGVGPDECLADNPGLVYGRMTGWGQEGPLAGAAGHDLNYIALAGALHPIGPPGGKPLPPLNLVGDYAGGGLMLAFGMVSALLGVARGGKGQVVDAAMVDGASTLMAFFHGLEALGLHDSHTGSSFLSGAAHYYDTYATSDGRFVAIASLEPQFYELLIDALGLDRRRFADAAFDLGSAAVSGEDWAELKRAGADRIRTRSRDDWCRALEGSDICFAPVLTLAEARQHPHNVARRAFVDVGGRPQPAPAPRFSTSVADDPVPGPAPGAHTDELLAGIGYGPDDIEGLIRDGAVFRAG